MEVLGDWCITTTTTTDAFNNIFVTGDGPVDGYQCTSRTP